MSSQLWIIADEESSATDRALATHAEHWGIASRKCSADDFAREARAEKDRNQPGARLVVALSALTARRLGSSHDLMALLGLADVVLVHGCAAWEADPRELIRLSGGAIRGIGVLGGGSRRFSAGAGTESRSSPIAGLGYVEDVARVPFLDCNASATGLEVQFQCDDRPIFVSLCRGEARWYFLADSALVDLDTELPAQAVLRTWYPQLIAIALFLRQSFGASCWTAPLTPACFIIDDPCLRERYGFFHYASLLADLERSGSALTVAYIPYNHRRSDPRIVSLVRRYPEHFSIAVHGCDHTGSEFGSLDEEWLAGSAHCALERMRKHEGRFGMPFDNVMVFPQGQFSRCAIRALRRCGYAGAVNSGPWPVDYAAGERLRVRDLLGGAVTRYDSFPLFVRRYPTDLFDYAFDALFQKAVLGVEHHAYFRRGHGAFLDTVRGISSLSARVKWLPLGRALESTCLTRQVGDRRHVLRHYTPQLRFRNPTQDELHLELEVIRREETVGSVRVGNRNVDFEEGDGYLKYSARLGPGEELISAVEYQRPAIPRRVSRLGYSLGVVIRRGLSDLRDNHLARNESVLRLAERAKTLILPRLPRRPSAK